jgi:hypothetical protein
MQENLNKNMPKTKGVDEISLETYDFFDWVVASLQILLLSPLVLNSDVLTKGILPLLIFGFFIISLILKFWDHRFLLGLKVLAAKSGYYTLVMYLAGALGGGVMAIVFGLNPLLGLLEEFFGLDRSGLAQSEGILSVVGILLVAVSAIGYLPFFYTMALVRADEVTNYEPSQESKANIAMRLISRIGIVLQASVMMYFLYKVIGPDTDAGGDVVVSYIAILFMITIFYLPVRFLDYPYQPSAKHLRNLLIANIFTAVYATSLAKPLWVFLGL